MRKILLILLLISNYCFSQTIFYYNKRATTIDPRYPQKLTDLVYWVRADSVSLKGGNRVYLWQDMSGNNYDASQNYELYPLGCPTYVPNELNGQPVVRWTNVEALTCTDGTGLYLHNNPRTTYAVFRVEPNGDHQNPIFGQCDGSYIGYWIDVAHIMPADTMIVLSAKGSVGPCQKGFWEYGMQPHGYNIMTFIVDTVAETSSLYINNVLKTTVDCSAQYPCDVTGTSYFQLGTFNNAVSTDILNGDIAEIVMTNSVLTNAEKDSMWAYFNYRYGDRSYTTLAVSPTDTTTCSGGIATLIASNCDAYTWSTGATTSSITVSPTTSTTYTVTGSDVGLKTTATCRVQTTSFTASVTYGADTTVTASAGFSYSWNTGATTSAITVHPTANTTYTVTGIAGSCTNTAQVVVYSVWSPADSAGLDLWLMADTGITKNASDSVSAWADQSGQGNNFSQSTANKKPVWVDNQVNGEPVVRFNGTAYMSAGDVLDLRTHSRTLIIITKYANTGTVATWLGKYPGNGHNYPYYTNTNVGIVVANTTPSCVIASPNAAHTKGSYEAVTFLIDRTGNAISVYIDTTFLCGASMSDNTCDINTTEDLELGAMSSGTFNLNGDIAEVIEYDHAMSASLKTNLDTYIFTKYGLHIE